MNSWDADPHGGAPPGPDATAPAGAGGRWVVLAMFAFGLLATGGMWLYWELHTRPFRPLQEAIVQAFPGSNPRVQGGQAKMHKGTPRILRIVMRVDFDPVSQADRAQQVASQVAALAGRHQDLSGYDRVEIGLFQPLAEQDPRMRTLEFDADEVRVANE